VQLGGIEVAFRIHWAWSGQWVRNRLDLRRSPKISKKNCDFSPLKNQNNPYKASCTTHDVHHCREFNSNLGLGICVLRIAQPQSQEIDSSDPKVLGMDGSPDAALTSPSEPFHPVENAMDKNSTIQTTLPTYYVPTI
jgi:hypothetical protein